MRALVAGIASLLVACACGSTAPLPVGALSSPPAATTASPSSGPTPVQAVSAGGASKTVPEGQSKIAVMVDLFADQGGYDVSLVSTSGLVAKARGRQRTPIPDAIELPYVSASSSRVYYLDGDQSVRWLKPDGSSGAATQVPGSALIHATFAVSPDDSRIAVALLDYSASPVALTVYIEDLAGGGHHKVIFTSTNHYVWPIGWHAGQLVVAYLGPNVAPFKSKVYFYSNRDLNDYPYGPNPYGGINAHVISTTDAQRLAIIGGGGNSGLLGPAGSAVVQGGIVDWSGNYGWSGPIAYGSISAVGSLSPDGQKIVACCWPAPAASGVLAVWFPDGSSKSLHVSGTSGDWVGWLDNEHVITGFYQRSDGSSSIVNLDTGAVAPVDVHGIVAAMLPGALDG